jgi:hypothetical protein
VCATHFFFALNHPLVEQGVGVFTGSNAEPFGRPAFSLLL